MDIFSIIGDALWIVALTVMAGASRNARRRIDPAARVPMIFSFSGAPGWRAPRDVALAFNPVVALVVGLVLLVVYSQAAYAGSEGQALALFGVRLLLPPVFAFSHLSWLKSAMTTLAREGALKSEV